MVQVGLFYRSPTGAVSGVPLQSVEVTGTVSDFTSHLQIVQTYLNNTFQPIKTEYQFPLDDGVCVTSFSATIGSRTINGVIKPRDEARRIYNQAVAERKVASLLEQSQEAGDLFRISLGNLGPNEIATVRISVAQEINLDGNTIRFTMPMSVYPRYTPANSPVPISVFADNPWDQMNQANKGALDKLGAKHRFSINLTISLNGGVNSVSSPSHPISMSLIPGAVRPSFGVSLGQYDIGLDKDFVLVIRPETIIPAHATIETDPSTGTQAVQLTFWQQLPPAATLPCELIFLIDRSGSMGGAKIQSVRRMLQVFLRSLPNGSLFNIVSFGSNYSLLFPDSVPYNDYNLAAATNHVNSLDANMGGTEILQPLQAVLNRPSFPGYDRQVFVLTDGEVSNVNEVIHAAASGSQSARVFSFGIGAQAGRALVKGIARARNGACEFIGDNEDITAIVLRHLERALAPAARNVSVDWGEPFSRNSGPFRVIQSPAKAPPIFARSRYLIYGIFKGEPGTPLPPLRDMIVSAQVSQELGALYDDPMYRVAPGVGVNDTSEGQAQSPQSSQHFGIECNGCRQNPLTGIRFACSSCPNYSLCQSCFTKGVHGIAHQFNAISAPPPPPVTLPDGTTIHQHVTCDGCRTTPLYGIRFKCSTCPDYDLCESCFGKSVHGETHHSFNAFRSPINTVHQGVTCDGCHTHPLNGLRFKCQQCPDFDLCGRCHANGVHRETGHTYRVIVAPDNVMVPAISPGRLINIRIALDRATQTVGTAIHKLAARRRIQELEDSPSAETPQVKTEIRNLGVTYGVVSTETSFVATGDDTAVASVPTATTVVPGGSAAVTPRSSIPSWGSPRSVNACVPSMSPGQGSWSSPSHAAAPANFAFGSGRSMNMAQQQQSASFGMRMLASAQPTYGASPMPAAAPAPGAPPPPACTNKSLDFFSMGFDAQDTSLGAVFEKNESRKNIPFAQASAWDSATLDGLITAAKSDGSFDPSKVFPVFARSLTANSALKPHASNPHPLLAPAGGPAVTSALTQLSALLSPGIAAKLRLTLAADAVRSNPGANDQARALVEACVSLVATAMAMSLFNRRFGDRQAEWSIIYRKSTAALDAAYAKAIGLCAAVLGGSTPAAPNDTRDLVSFFESQQA